MFAEDQRSRPTGSVLAWGKSFCDTENMSKEKNKTPEAPRVMILPTGCVCQDLSAWTTLSMAIITADKGQWMHTSHCLHHQIIMGTSRCSTSTYINFAALEVILMAKSISSYARAWCEVLQQWSKPHTKKMWPARVWKSYRWRAPGSFQDVDADY